MVQFILAFVAFVCAALLSYTTTPAVRVLAFKIGAVDVPLDKRRIHTKPIPRIGGLAIYISLFITTLMFCDISDFIITIWVGGAALVVIGILDDIYRISAWIKLLVQIAVAIFAVMNGCVIEIVNIGGYIALGWLSYPLSVLWIVGLTNSINFIDGLDGLACGVSAISTLSLLAVVLLHGDYVSALFCLILLGSCIGFLPFNANPARIFMGDTGALLLGFILAVLSVNGVFKLHAMLSFIVPLAIFALPLFDTLFAIVRRVIKKKNPFSADRSHIHHRLIDMGFTQKESVRILYAICGILGLVAVFCSEQLFTEHRAIKTVGIALIAMAILVLNMNLMKNPVSRKHSGLTDDDITVDQYMSELPPDFAKKLEAHNNESARHSEEKTEEK